MCITVAEVRDLSLTGEFDAIADAKIEKQISRVCSMYKTAREKDWYDWRKVVALHTAHNMHMQLVAEGQGGGIGQVTSESFAQVGSRSYATQDLPKGMEAWGAWTPYLPDLIRALKGFPPGLHAVPLPP